MRKKEKKKNTVTGKSRVMTLTVQHFHWSKKSSKFFDWSKIQRNFYVEPVTYSIFSLEHVAK